MLGYLGPYLVQILCHRTEKVRVVPPQSGAAKRDDQSRAGSSPRPRTATSRGDYGVRRLRWKRFQEDRAHLRGDAVRLCIDAGDQRATQLCEMLPQRSVGEGFRQYGGIARGHGSRLVDGRLRLGYRDGLETRLLSCPPILNEVQLVEHLRHVGGLDLLRHHADGTEGARLAEVQLTFL